MSVRIQNLYNSDDMGRIRHPQAPRRRLGQPHDLEAQTRGEEGNVRTCKGVSVEQEGFGSRRRVCDNPGGDCGHGLWGGSCVVERGTGSESESESQGNDGEVGEKDVSRERKAEGGEGEGGGDKREDLGEVEDGEGAFIESRQKNPRGEVKAGEQELEGHLDRNDQRGENRSGISEDGEGGDETDERGQTGLRADSILNRTEYVLQAAVAMF